MTRKRGRAHNQAVPAQLVEATLSSTSHPTSATSGLGDRLDRILNALEALTAQQGGHASQDLLPAATESFSSDSGHQDSPQHGVSNTCSKRHRGQSHCNTCGKRHLGQCQAGSTRCYQCGEDGHIKKNCPKRLPQTGGAQAQPTTTASTECFTSDATNPTRFDQEPPQDGVNKLISQQSHCNTCGKRHLGQCQAGSRGCYQCGEDGHVKMNCPKKLQKAGGTQTQPTTIVSIESLTSNVGHQAPIYQDPPQNVVNQSSSKRLRCNTCGKYHPGQCQAGSKGCYKCGEDGHITKSCPEILQKSGGAQTQPVTTIITTTHSRQDVGRGTTGTSEGQQRLYAINSQDAEASNAVVTVSPPDFGLVHLYPSGPPIFPPPGDFAPFHMLSPPMIMEQKLACQHLEMKTLVTENQRLAATYGTLKGELAAAQHELQLLHAQIEEIKSSKEQHTKGLEDKISMIKAELQAGEAIKMELQQARAEAKTLIAARQELIFKRQQLTQDLQKSHSDVQQFPPMLAELESLRQEYQHFRDTYDHERKVYNDHLESLQLMEKNYMAMAREVEKLRAEVTNNANFEGRTAGSYSDSTGYVETDNTKNYPVGQNVYADGYGVPQGRALLPTETNAGGISGGTSPHAGAQSVPASDRPSYDASKMTSYDASKMTSYDAQRGTGGPSEHGYDAHIGPTGPSYNPHRGSWLGVYEAQRGRSFDIQRGSGYEGQRGPVYDAQRGSSYDVQRGSNYNANEVSNYDALSKSLLHLKDR